MPSEWRLSTSLSDWVIPELPQAYPFARTWERDAAAKVDARGLERALREAVRGEMRFDPGSRALYATGGSNYRQVPIGVVIPRDERDVIEGIRICREHGAPVFSRGGGTSLAGQCCNVAVCFDFSKYMNRVISIDPERRVARVMPGTILDHLRDQAERYHLTFGPDPSTHTHCTLGGMIGNNSCGVHAQMAGRTADNVHELDILTYDGLRMRVGATSELELERIIRSGGARGELYGKLKRLRDRYGDLIRRRYPRIPRRVSGYNLDELLPENGFHVARALVGSESTLVTVLEATVKLVYSPAQRVLVLLGYDSVYEAADHVMEVLEHGPIGLEGLDDRLVDNSIRKGLHPDARKSLPEGNGWLLVEFGAPTRKEAEEKARAMVAALELKPGGPKARIYDDREEEERIWQIRESGLGATARVPGERDTWEGWEDSAVPPERLGSYLRALRALLGKYQYACALYGHFGQGCVHTRIDFDLLTADGIRKYRSFMSEAADLVLAHGGSLSGEHGDGQSRAEFLPRMFGPELIEAFREFKSIWDPRWRMNPGKIVDPYRIDENLRLGTAYNPPQLRTRFSYPDDKGSFPYATLRCVGVGKCRRTEGGVMCPSFMVTREERHSTRGRAHLLYEMIQGDPMHQGWRSDAVKEALDLCLACKGCKSDCPVNVDMATYKAEFLSHYYKGRTRPIAAYAMGYVDVWARLASLAPNLVNFVTHAPILGMIAKRIAGIAPERRVPKFASMTFKEWFRARGPRNEGRSPVILWADTFNNHFHPATAQAAVEVLETAGFRVIVPMEPLCCGRPFYDFGMLDQAKGYLRRVIDTLRPLIREGVPVVGLEPSCISVFKDELKGLFPHDQDGNRLRSQTYMLGEFLARKAPGFELPKLRKKALIQGHCHHRAVLGFEDETRLLGKMGIHCEPASDSCCGMAGSFGFESGGGKYEVSMKIGERKLLPAVRKAPPDTLIVANGFSCRTQIEQGTRRRAMHFAQVLQMALREGALGGRRRMPERDYAELEQVPAIRKLGGPGDWFALGFTAALAAGWALSRGSGTRRRREQRAGTNIAAAGGESRTARLERRS